MRAVIAIVAVALLLGLIGWVSYDVESNTPSATVETEKIEKDLESVSEAAEDAGRDVSEALDPDESADLDEPADVNDGVADPDRPVVTE